MAWGKWIRTKCFNNQNWIRIKILSTKIYCERESLNTRQSDDCERPRLVWPRNMTLKIFMKVIFSRVKISISGSVLILIQVELNLVPTDLSALDQLVSERIQNVPRTQKQVESDFEIVGSQPNEIIIEKWTCQIEMHSNLQKSLNSRSVFL